MEETAYKLVVNLKHKVHPTRENPIFLVCCLPLGIITGSSVGHSILLLASSYEIKALNSMHVNLSLYFVCVIVFLCVGGCFLCCLPIGLITGSSVGHSTILSCF